MQHPNSAKLAQLLAAPEWDAAACPADRASVEAMSAKEREKLKHGGRRLAADGLMACVLGHNDPGMRFCVHFAEDRCAQWRLLALHAAAHCSSAGRHSTSRMFIAASAAMVPDVLQCMSCHL